MMANRAHAQFVADRNAIIVSDYRLGKPVRDIATEMNLSRCRVRQVLRAAGICFRPQWVKG